MGISRRDVLISSLSAVTGASLFGMYTGTLEFTPPTVTGGGFGGISTSENDPMTQELSGGFDRMEWQPDGSADVYFVPSHQMASFDILHESQDNRDPSLGVCSAPSQFEKGPQSVPLLEYLQSTPGEYPSRRFKLVGSRGNGPRECNEARYSVIIEVTSVTYFTVPERFEL